MLRSPPDLWGAGRSRRTWGAGLFRRGWLAVRVVRHALGPGTEDFKFGQVKEPFR